MKNALFEGAAAHRSRDVMASEAAPRRNGRTPINLTALDRHPENLATLHPHSIGHALLPHLTLHRFRKQQLSPVPSSPPDLDYKRVRRKPSFDDVTQGSSTSSWSPLIVTSPAPQPHFSSVGPLLPSLLPPTPLTPTPRPATSSPSLSSTVDTLPSTPSYTPSQHTEPAFGRWVSTGGSEPSEPSEPIRTKRKLSFKQAKRLPHPEIREVGSGSGSGIWQVHAAIVDVPGEDVEIRNIDRRVRGDHVTLRREVEGERQHRVAPGSEEKKGRSVRFKEETRHSAKNNNAHSRQQSSEGALTSSYSLSNFKFPAPPGHHWTGTFGMSASSRILGQTDHAKQVTSQNRHHQPAQLRSTIRERRSTWSIHTHRFY